MTRYRPIAFPLAALIAAAATLPAAAGPAPLAGAGVIIPVQASTDLPPVEYDVAKLPEPVRKLREQLMEIARTGDIEKLRPLMKPGAPTLSDTSAGDGVEFLKTQSGDEEGREILAILLEVLEAGYVHADIGTPDEAYIWPYFARQPLDKLTARQMVELFKLITAGDYEDMKSFGAYIFYRIAIRPDGTWQYFIAGD